MGSCGTNGGCECSCSLVQQQAISSAQVVSNRSTVVSRSNSYADGLVPTEFWVSDFGRIGCSSLLIDMRLGVICNSGAYELTAVLLY